MGHYVLCGMHLKQSGSYLSASLYSTLFINITCLLNYLV